MESHQWHGAETHTGVLSQSYSLYLDEVLQEIVNSDPAKHLLVLSGQNFCPFEVKGVQLQRGGDSSKQSIRDSGTGEAG